MHKQRIAIASGALAGMIGCFLPWFQVPFESGAYLGIGSGVGQISAVVFMITLLLTQWGDRRQVLGGGKRVAAVVCAALAGVTSLSLISLVSQSGAGIGIGLYLVLAASFAICVLAYLIKD